MRLEGMAQAQDQYVEALRRASAEIRALREENKALAAAGPVAVVGMGCRFPGGADNPEMFWRLLAEGRDCVAPISGDRFDLERWYDPDPAAAGRFYAREAALIDDPYCFDAGFFRITPAEAEALDPQQRLLLEVSWEAFEDAGLDVRRLAGSRTGVFIGLSNYDYIQAHVHSGDPALITPYSGSGVMFSTAAGRLSYFYDLRGACVTLDTACSSSLVALDSAMKVLRRRECDAALAGGVSLILSPDSSVALCKVRALAPDGRSRAFDDAAAGYGRGEGCGLLVLKRLEDAVADRDPIQAVLAGSAVNHDGRSNGLTSPNGLAQQAVIRAALADARLSPADIDYVEAHGTGTSLGDPIEFGALDAVFGRRPRDRALLLGSVKTNIGHSEAAAGVAGVIKAVLAIRNGRLPASLHFQTPNRHIDWDSASIEVVAEARPWRARAAGVSSFGLSGTNAHVVVTAPPAQDAGQPVARPPFVLPLSAASSAGLAASAAAWRARISEADSAELASLCAAASRRTPLGKRLIAIGADAASLGADLQAAAERPPSTVGEGGTAFLFTGQGAHYAGMAAALLTDEPVFRTAFEQCAAVAADRLGRPLAALLEDAGELGRTCVAQPAIFALQWALSQLWASRGLVPDAVAGHSVGEFAAAAVAGAISPEDAMELVVERGLAMQALPSGGAMAAVFAAPDRVLPYLSNHADRLAMAAANAPRAVTLSGEAEALAEVLEVLAREGIDSVPLDVSHAFHSPLMGPMIPGFRRACDGAALGAPRLAFYSTVTGASLPGGTLLSSDYWANQIRAPVRFADALAAMRADGFERFLEIGPGDVLAGFARAAGARVAVPSLRRGEDDRTALARAAGELWRDGAEIDWRAGAAAPAVPVPAPHYPFQRKRYWMEVGPLRPARLSPFTDPGPAAAAPAKEAAMSGTSILEGLIDTMASITGLDRTEINPREHLTDVGLDSLMLLKFGQAIERDYGVELKMSQLFKDLATLAAIEAYLEANATRRPAGAPPAGAAETVPEAQGRAAGPAAAAAPVAPAGEGLFEQQLQAMTALAAQNLASLTELARMQLAASGDGPQPEREPAPQAEARPKRPKAPAPVPVAQIRGINLAGARLSSEQQAYVDRLVAAHVGRTGGSKARTRDSRAILADWKHTLSFWGQLKEAKYPIVSAGSEGPYVTDVDGNRYIDVAMGMGVHFFGHRPAFIHDALARQLDKGIELGTQTPFAAEAARLIAELTGAERVAFSNTGSEVVMVSLRLARAATGRKTVVLFKNSYHGIFDGVLATEEGGETVPVGIGTPEGMLEDVVVLPYDSEESLDYIRAHSETLAAVLVEPVQSRDPDLQPQGFLKALRRITRESGTALIFDEMINGFRTGPGGAQAWFGVDADIVLYGKIVGGGMPIGVVAGRKRFLDYIDGGDWAYGDRSGPQSAMIYFGGTFCRNPATMTAAHAALAHMKAQGPALQEGVTARTAAFCDRLNCWFERRRVPLRAKHFSSQWRIVPIGPQEREPIELELLYLGMLVRGVYTWERRISFFSTAHEQEQIDAVFDAITSAVEEIRANGFDWSVDSYPDPQFEALSSAERRLYALSQREGGEAPYHLPQAFAIGGPLDVDRLEEAFRAVIRRHPALRTAFVTIDGVPFAKRIAEPRFAIERVDLAAGGEERFIADFIRPFDLAAAPLIRVAVGRIAADRHLLLADTHHIAVDGLSFDIVAAELMALYEGQALPPVGYDLVAAREAASAGMEGARGERNASFWRGQLADLPLLELPTDRPRPVERDFAGDAVIIPAAAELVGRLKSLGRARGGASLYMVLLAAWSGFLHRLTGQEDIVVAGASSGREAAALAQAVGMFVNTIAFRTRPRGDLPFAAHLEATAEVALAAYDHADFPFEAAAALAPAPPPGRNAVFDTMLSYEDATARRFEIADLAFEALEIPMRAAMFDLSLDITEVDGALTLRFGFARQLFERGTVEHWARAFVRMLEDLVDDPHRPIGDLDLRTAEDAALIASLNDTAAAYPRDATLVTLFDRIAGGHGGRTAVCCDEGQLDYAALDCASDALAAEIALRAPRGARIGMLLPRTSHCVVAELAIMKAGCVFVPLDVAHPPALLAHILADSGCAAVVTDASSSPLLPGETSALALDLGASAGRAPRPADRAPAPEDVAYVIYTSGSTGLPKGCLVTHRNAVRLLANDRMPFAFEPSDVFVCAHSFTFDFSVWEVWGALAYGGCVVVASAETARDPHALHALVRRRRVTVLNQTPASFYGFIEAERSAPEHELDSHLHTVIFGGDRLEPAYLRPWARLYPLEGIALVNMYGITETTVHVTWHRLGAADLASGRSAIGRPLPETIVELLDRRGRPVPVGVPGEMWIGGSGVCAGYIERPALTAERFVTREGRLFYRSGDIGRLGADGVLEYRGRDDHQAQVRGHRVELAGIEHWLLGHPGVDKAVVAVEDDVLTAYLVCDSGLTAERLRAHLAATLPDHAIPTRFLRLPALPLTANGKIDRSALAAAEGASLPASAGARSPQTPAEARIAQIWAEVLGVAEVGADQDYFALGGDSIKALQIIGRLHAAGLKASLAQLLAARTVARLAANLAGANARPVEETGDSAPLTPIQRWFLETHGSAPDHFNNAVLLAADRIDAPALARAIEALVARHQALRLFLDLGRHEQRIAPAAAALETVEVADGAALAAHAAALQGEFDVSKAPLIRFVRYCLPGDERLLLLCHHLVVDGVSWRILIEDLIAAYRAECAGVAAELPPATPWLAWPAALASAAREPALLEEIPYWQAIEAAEIEPLPRDFDDEVNAVAHVRNVSFELDEGATAGLLLRAAAAEGGMPPLLLGALGLAAGQEFGLERLRLRLEGHGREEIAAGLDVSRTIGWFTSLYPLVIDVAGAKTLEAAAGRVWTALAAVPRKGIGYGLLRYLTPPELRPGLGFAAAPEIGFNYMGHFDETLGGGFRLVDEPTGPSLGPALRRPELIDVETAIVGGRLRIAVGYGERIHSRATVERFAERLRAALLETPPADHDSALVEAPGIEASEIEAVLPLSPLQQGMAFHALAGDRDSYLQQFTFHLRGELDPDAIAAAWQEVVARHQALRATIVQPPGESPRQVVLKSRPTPTRIEDLRKLPARKRDRRLAALSAKEREGGFDLARDPLLRLVVARMTDSDTRLVLTLHHIVADGWSLGIMLSELMTLYRGERLPAAPPFARHLEWLGAQDPAPARRYWNKRLHDAPPPAPIPGLRETAGQPYERLEHAFAFDPSATGRLVELAAAIGVTLNTVVQAQWAALLAGFSGDPDVVFGAIDSGRPAELPGVEAMVGLFLQPVPVRARADGSLGFAALARSIQHDAAEAAPFRHYPLDEMQRLEGRRRTLFDHVLVFENYPFASLGDGGLAIEGVDAIEQMHFPFSIVVEPGEVLTIRFACDGRAIDEPSLRAIEAQWRRLSDAILDDPDRALETICLAGAPTAVAAAAVEGTALDLFAHQVALRPEAVALVEADETLTYGALDARAAALAEALAAGGVRRGDRVASFQPAGVGHVTTLLAAWKAGAVFVPIDVEAPPRRLARIARRIDARAWVTSPSLRQRLDDSIAPPVDQVVVVDNAAAFDPPARPQPGKGPEPGDPAYVMFTSGSTGEPKAILANHAGLRHFIHWEAEEIAAGAGVRVANLAGATFDVSLRDILLPLAVGGTVCIAPPDARQGGARLVQWLADARIEVAHVVPSLFRTALAAMEGEDRPLPALRHLLFAGEILWGADVERVRAALGPDVALRNLYGPSETTLAKCCHRIEGQGDPRRPVPVGKPLPDTQVLVVKEGRLAATGAIGEIHIAPPFALPGYLGDPEATESHFVAAPPEWSVEGIFYRTGDMGRLLADGTIEVAGRLDGQVKVSGVRIELGEIEAAAIADPDVDSAVALAHPRPDGEPAIACYYTLKRPLASDELRRRLALDLPQAAMPHFLIELPSMPLGLNGKIDRRRLPKPEELAGGNAFVAPDGPIEPRVAAIWAEVLGVKRVGACTSFFEIGGDSLRAIRVLTRANAEFGAALTIAGLFAAPTVRAMAESLAQNAQVAEPPEPPAVAADHPASHAQRRLWVLDQLGGNPAAYVLSAAYLLEGDLDADALVAAIETLPGRHEALRTVFCEKEGELCQRVLPETDFRVERIDLGAEADPESAAQRRSEAFARQGFDLEAGPLLRASLLRLGDSRHVLLFAVHHIVSDAESVTVMVGEILARLRGEAPPPLRLQHKDHSAAEAAWLETPEAARVREWWLETLADLPPRLDLPFDRLPSGAPSHDGRRVSIALGGEAVSGLRALARDAGCSFFASLVALTAALLQRHTGCDEALLGMPVACRDDPELETQVGFYVNLLPLRIALDGTEDAATLVRRTGRIMAEAIDHRACPFDLIVEALALPRDESRPPLFDVAVVFQDRRQQTLRLDGLSVSRFGGEPAVAKYPLTFEFVEAEEAVTLNLEYSSDLFDGDRIERMAGHFANLAAAAARGPDRPLARMALLGPAEQALVTQTGPRTEPPEQPTVPAGFAAWASRSPKSPAVTCGGVTLSYGELRTRAEALAGRLAGEGVRPADVVAVVMERSESLVTAFLGVLMVGATYLPIDPAYPADRIAFMLADSGASLILVDGETSSPGTAAEVRTLDLSKAWDGIAQTPCPPRPEDAAYLIYTSGSTGRPKGVIVEHRAAANLALAQRRGLGIEPPHRIVQFAPPSFDASLWELVMALLNGACLVVARPEEVADPAVFAALLASERASVATLPPSYLAELSDEALAPLEILVTAGESPDGPRSIRLAAGRAVFNAYGPTETTVCASWHRVDERADPALPVPIGRAIANCEILVLDRFGNPAPLGVPGEIAVGGAGLARGYHGRPDLTEHAFPPHPHREGERIYLTGDRGVVGAGGEVIFAGRRDRQVKLRGHRVELDEVERSIAAVVSSGEVAVALNEGPTSGELVAYLVSADPEATAAALARTLPPHMLPGRWIVLEAMPLTPSGKTDYAALPKPAAAAARAPLEDADEAMIAEAWRAVLGHAAFGRHDRFFAVGGDSIRSIQVVGRLRAAGRRIDMRSFLANPTIAGIAALLEESEPAAAPEASARVALAEAAGLFEDG